MPATRFGCCAAARQTAIPALEQLQNGADPAAINAAAGAIVRIPLAVCPGDPLPFGPADIVLHDGDVIFIQSRTSECYYTGGLLPGGQFLLPRDYDLDVVDAISLAGGRPHGPAGFPLIVQVRSGSGPGNIIAPSRMIILRRVPGRGEVKIYVDLRTLMNDSRGARADSARRHDHGVLETVGADDEHRPERD